MVTLYDMYDIVFLLKNCADTLDFILINKYLISDKIKLQLQNIILKLHTIQ